MHHCCWKDLLDSLCAIFADMWTHAGKAARLLAALLRSQGLSGELQRYDPSCLHHRWDFQHFRHKPVIAYHKMATAGPRLQEQGCLALEIIGKSHKPLLFICSVPSTLMHDRGSCNLACSGAHPHQHVFSMVVAAKSARAMQTT